MGCSSWLSRRSFDGDVLVKSVDIYTDGGCRINPGPGGWAALIYEGPTPQEGYGAERDTTNQRMEIRAAIEGLKCLQEPS